mmetsp:Transcript_318/g.616  ORF Transcript_318/g.616 Transcript_318/m.616 type:complete len:88 (+) Transcript_318:155-418(+)
MGSLLSHRRDSQSMSFITTAYVCGFFNLKSITPTETVQQSNVYVTYDCSSPPSFMEAYITEESSATTPPPLQKNHRTKIPSVWILIS